MGVTHTVCNFDGRIIAALVPKDPENTDLKTIWIMASRSSRYINQDIYQYIDVKKDFPEYELLFLLRRILFHPFRGDLSESPNSLSAYFL